MALEDRIRTSVDQVLQTLVADLLSIHSDETARLRDEAAEQLRSAEQRFGAQLEQQVADLHVARQAEIDEAVRAAVEAERARLAAEAEQRHQSQVDLAAQVRQLEEAQQGFDQQIRALEEERRVAVAEAEARASAAAASSIAAARAGERESEMAEFARLVESIRGLDGATSLSEVLDALALAAARETARAAVVVVKGDHVVGWRLAGFGARDAQPKSIDLPLSDAGVIGVAASSSRAATTRNGETVGPDFAQLPPDRMGLAMPVLVGGRVVAVVYADGVTGDGHEQVVPSPWPEAIEVLARHAGRCLEALTAQKAGVPGPLGRKAAGSSPPEGASKIGAAG